MTSAKNTADELLTIFDALRQSFVSTLPYVVFTSTLILLTHGAKYFFPEFWLGSSDGVMAINSLLSRLFPVVIMISIAYHLAVYFRINRVTFLLLTLTASALCEIIFSTKFDAPVLLSPQGAFLKAFVIPLAAALLINRMQGIINSGKSGGDVPLESNVNYAKTTILPFFLTLTVILLAALFIRPLFNPVNALIVHFQSTLDPTNFLLIRTILSHLLWSIGIHGGNTLRLIFDDTYLRAPIYPELTLEGFHNTFIIYGGSGASLSLLIAIYAVSRDKYMRRLAKASTPLTIFNINELLVFGLPIIFNRHLFLPFICVPLMNFGLGYLALQMGVFQFNQIQIPWTTPVFINAYLRTDGQWEALAVQAFSLFIGALIYIPFVRRYSHTQSSSSHSKRLANYLNVSSDLQSSKEGKYHAAQASIIHSNIAVDKIIHMLESSTLMMYYQPKVDIESNSCCEFEALLRIKMPNDTIRGPFFLDQLENAGLASVIDIWVCRRVREDLGELSLSGFHPRVSVNLHPDTLGNLSIVQQITGEMKGLPIDFEIVERGDMNTAEIKSSIEHIKSLGFRISLDDFGSGFAGFSSINTLPVDIVKLDKSLLDETNFEKGLIVYRNASGLCRQIKMECISEGVENAGQLDIVKAAGIRYVQGYYLGMPMPVHEVVSFTKNLNIGAK